MKHRTHTLKGNTYSGPSSLTDVRSTCTQQTLNIGPGDIRSHRILENGVYCSPMSGCHGVLPVV